MIVYRFKLTNVNVTTSKHVGLEFSVVHLLSVLLKEKLPWQEVLVKVENVHQHKFNFNT